MEQPTATNGKCQDQESRIITASKAGNVEELRRAVVAEPGKVNTPDNYGLSPLFYAVKKGSLPCVKLLVSKNEQPMDVQTDEKPTVNSTEYELPLSPFLLACRLGHQSIVEFLFYKIGANLCQTKDDLNCLSLAIMYNHEETAKFLEIHMEYKDLLFLMKTVSRDLTLGRHAERMSTPMRQLIQYMPDVAEIVMDRCITLIENDVVMFHLELLDDYYSPWALQNTGPTAPTAPTAPTDPNAATAATAPIVPTAATGPPAATAAITPIAQTAPTASTDPIAATAATAATAPTDPTARTAATAPTDPTAATAATAPTDPTAAATAVTATTATTDPTASTATNNPTKVFDKRGNLLVGRAHKPKHAQIRKGQHPLALMQGQERHANLLTHPLSIKLIEHKWRILGSAVNSVSLIVYLFFLAFLTGYVLVTPSSFYVKFANKTTIKWYYDPPDKIMPDDTYSAECLFGGKSWIFLMVLVIFNIIKEIFQIFSKGRSYLDYQRILEWSIYVLTVALIIPINSNIPYDGYVLREKWQWNCGALAIFLAWINLALYVRQTLTFGIYVIMFEDVLCSTLQFLAVIMLFVNAFALAFHMLLQNQPDFHSFWDSFLRTIAMTIGELDFNLVFHAQNYLRSKNATSHHEDDFTKAVFSEVITRIMFVVFVIAMPIIAMNLLVGVAVEDIHRIRQKATFYYMKLKVDRIITAENTAFSTPLTKYIIRCLPITVQYLKIQLSRRSKLTRFRMWFTSVVDFEKLRESVRAVCKRNQERQELRAQKSSCSHKDQPDGGPDQTLLQKLCQMRDQMRDEINGLISQVEQRTL